VVFLIPGLDGDELRLAAFRADLRDEVRFFVIDYPNWTEIAVDGQGFDTIVTSVVAKILSIRTSGPIWLAGYSYGGDVGFAVASRLLSEGQEVAFLGILDTDLYQVAAEATTYSQNRSSRRWHHRIQEMVTEGRGTGLGFLLAKCARDLLGLERAARYQFLWQKLLPPRTKFAFDRRLRRISRLREQWRWHQRGTPPPIDIPSVLFRSGAHDPEAPPDLNWRRRCPNLTVVDVEGDHRTMLDAPNRAGLCRRFAEAVAAVQGMRGRKGITT
jgi:thioesterase domain-containing protein